MRLHKIKQRFGERVSLKWHPFALRPQPDPAPFRFQGSYVENAWRRASQLAESDGLSYTMWRPDEFPRWSMPALEAGAAVQRQGEEVFLRFHSGLFQAFFVANRSLIDRDTLVDTARSAGADMSAFLRDVEDREFQDSVRAECREAVETYMVSAVPTVLIGGERRQMGMVPAEAYLEDLAALGVK